MGDKINAAAGVPISAITERFTAACHADMAALDAPVEDAPLAGQGHDPFARGPFVTRSADFGPAVQTDEDADGSHYFA
ncbi:hypothetical protein [Paenirhodobacter sp.]|uniref:hypothetical protein n=1 Tax=Paenirhodobacter sp. TaxID=1965326 RepID=UPI003B40ECA5